MLSEKLAFSQAGFFANRFLQSGSSWTSTAKDPFATISAACWRGFLSEHQQTKGLGVRTRGESTQLRLDGKSLFRLIAIHRGHALLMWVCLFRGYIFLWFQRTAKRKGPLKN